MSKISALNDVASLTNEQSVVAAINDNNDKIEQALQNTLSRDGSTPNAMESNLDMNSKRIINLPAPSAPTDPVRLQDVAGVTIAITADNTVLPTRALAIVATVNPSVQWITTQGYDAVGDRGGGFYKRVISEPSHAGKFQSADGAWWELVEKFPTPFQFGAVGDGIADDADAINDALAYAASVGVSVYLPPSTFLVSSTVFMQPNVEMFGHKRTSIIKQANSANLGQIVDFSGFNGGPVATGGTLRSVTVDGNRANNTGRLLAGIDGIRNIYYGNTNFVTVDDCIIKDAPGYGMHGASCVGLVVTRNQFTNTEAHQFFLVHTTGNFDADCQISDNTFDNCILVAGVNGASITRNQFVGKLIGFSGSPMTVNISGTTVTWVSGPNFSTAVTGLLLIASNGTKQSFIKQITSSTSLEVADNLGTASGVPAMIGTEDLLGAAGVKRTVIADNILRNGASFGISLAGLASTKIDSVIIADNFMTFQGKNGFALLGDGGGGGGIGAQNIVITGNQVTAACQGGLAGNPAGGANTSYIITGSVITNVLLDNNYALDGQGLTNSWLNVSGLAVGSVNVGPGNHQIGAANPGIFGGISSITLDPGWGSTASVTSITSYGHAAMFTITANGTGIAANPAVTVNTVATKPLQGNSGGQNPLFAAKVVGGTGAIAPLYNENFSGPNSVVLRYSGTPVAGQTYQIQVT